MKEFFHSALFLIPRLSALIWKLYSRARNLDLAHVTRSLWTGQAIHTLATKAKAESLYGVQAHSLVFKRYGIRGGFTYDLSGVTALPIIGKVLPYFVLSVAIWRYQRFHFFYNRGFLAQIRPGLFNQDELRLLAGLGKQTFFWAYGADVRDRTRTAQLELPNCCSVCPSVGDLCVCDYGTATQNYDFIAQHATGLATMGDMANYCPGAVTDVFYWPVDLEESAGSTALNSENEPGAVAASRNAARLEAEFKKPDCLFDSRSVSFTNEMPLCVAHAPNNTALKGTAHLLRAVEEINAELGHEAIKVDLVQGVENSEVLDRFRAAHVVFDQCIIGFHGYTALEAMALRRPVIAYLRAPEQDLADAETCPIINADPTQIKAALLELLNDPSRLAELGDAGREYVEKFHTISAVGQRIASHTKACTA